MPTTFNARQIAEEALKKVGAFPSSRDQADAAELQRTLIILETMLSHAIGTGVIAGSWDTFEVALEASVNSYKIDDYNDDYGTQSVFSATLVSGTTGAVICDVDIITEKQFNELDHTQTGQPLSVFINRDRETPRIKIHPMPGVGSITGEWTLRVRNQTFLAQNIGSRGNANQQIKLRHSWYQWAIVELAYLIGNGPIRTLEEGRLNRLQRDAAMYRIQLEGHDNRERRDDNDSVEGYY